MNKNIEIGRRIKRRREELDLTQGDLGKNLLLNKSTIQRYEAGKIANIKLPILHALAKQLNVDPDWLALKTDEQGTFREKKDWFDGKKLGGTLDDLDEGSTISLLSQDKIRLIPIFESVSAGFGAYADDHIAGYIPCFIRSDEEARNTLCITVQGDSMYPKIESGDIVQVLRQDWAESGQIAAVIIDNEATLKRVYYYPEKNKLILSPENPKYEPLVYLNEELETIRILGKAVYFMSAL